jgi:hypothetical protein
MLVSNIIYAKTAAMEKCTILNNFHMCVQFCDLMTNFQPVQFEILRAVTLRLTIWGVLQHNPM